MTTLAMAKMTMNAGFAGGSGRLGNAVLVQTENGPILRQRPDYVPPRTAKQIAVGNRMAWINLAWDGLTFVQAEAWRAYGKAQKQKGYSAFVALGAKYLQLHGGSAVPMNPPAEPFLGDLVRVAPSALPSEVRFDADRANAHGTVTELLAQRLTGPNNAPKKDGYRTLGFTTFTTGSLTALFDLEPGPYALAYRFVENATGRMGELMPIGRVVVSASV